MLHALGSMQDGDLELVLGTRVKELEMRQEQTRRSIKEFDEALENLELLAAIEGTNETQSNGATEKEKGKEKGKEKERDKEKETTKDKVL